jgi:hypothetical protein
MQAKCRWPRLYAVENEFRWMTKDNATNGIMTTGHLTDSDTDMLA